MSRDLTTDEQLAQVTRERDAYRDVLTRLTDVSKPSQLWPALWDARRALEYWGAAR